MPKKRPWPSRRTKDWIRTDSIVRSLWSEGLEDGVGESEARGRFRDEDEEVLLKVDTDDV
jgi:hypothetical protein